jgi:hypothetical protein
MRQIRHWLLIILMVGVANGQSPIRQVDGSRPPRFKIARRYRTVRSRAISVPPTLVLQVSVDPKSFDRERMLALADELKKRFPKEERVSAIFFSDYRAARSFTGRNDKQLVAVRGEYYLDRRRGEEQVTFTPDPNEPQRITKIEISIRNC